MYNISLGLEPCFCDLISRLWLHRDVTDPQQSFLHLLFFISSKKSDRDRAFMVAVLKLWSKLPAIDPSVTRGKFSPYIRVFTFYYLIYVFLRRSHKKLSVLCEAMI